MDKETSRETLALVQVQDGGSLDKGSGSKDEGM